MTKMIKMMISAQLQLAAYYIVRQKKRTSFLIFLLCASLLILDRNW